MIVLGMGFGDEGKGLTTSYLCDQVSEPIVVRFNGGHQAGHTVVYDGMRHVFSSFGSGTLQGAPTYWSRFCTIHPVGFMNEWDALVRLKEDTCPAEITCHPLCPITTPYDVKFNHQMEDMTKTGSVGVGFGATIARQEAYYKLHLQDLFYPRVLEEKLRRIKAFYIGVEVSQEEMAAYMEAVEKLKQIVNVRDEWYLIENKSRLIFEGAQGILLDMDHGFFPHVTRSNTTCKNARILMPDDIEEVYYVTRCYQTRHGAGFMTNETESLELINNEKETNIYTPWQGKFRVGELDYELMNYALTVDGQYAQGLKRNIVITCLDQRPDFDVQKLLDNLEVSFDEVYISRGPELEDIEEY